MTPKPRNELLAEIADLKRALGQLMDTNKKLKLKLKRCEDWAGQTRASLDAAGVKTLAGEVPAVGRVNLNSARLTVNVPTDLLYELEEWAAANGRTVAQALRFLLGRALKAWADAAEGSS